MESGDTATLPLSSSTNNTRNNVGERTSLIMPQRPCSLFNAEKESLSFQINLVGAPPEVEQLIEHIKSVAEQFLYHWKTFPISESFCVYSFRIDFNIVSKTFKIFPPLWPPLRPLVPLVESHVQLTWETYSLHHLSMNWML